MTTQSFFSLNEDFSAGYWTNRATLSPFYPLCNFSFSMMFLNLFGASIRPPSSNFNFSFEFRNYALLVTERPVFHLQPSLLCPDCFKGKFLAGSLWCWRNTGAGQGHDTWELLRFLLELRLASLALSQIKPLVCLILTQNFRIDFFYIYLKLHYYLMIFQH